MKIFKNRGDIYISKNNYKSSREERILVFLLIVIVIFTLVFFGILSHKYSSVKDFFAGDVITTEIAPETEENNLPSISGKNNFLIFETDKEQSTIHYIFIVQADGDNLSYKVCTLSPNMNIDGKSIFDIYSRGGGASVQTELTSYLGINIDYYAVFTREDMIEFINKMGTFIYPSPQAIKFNSKVDDNEDAYNVRIPEGETKLDGNEVTALLRYFTEQKKDYENSNQVILFGITQLFNSENYEDCEGLFRLFINSSTTNITVRNFQEGKESLNVFCNKNTDVTVYSAVAQYDNNNVINPSSTQQIKGYFSE